MPRKRSGQHGYRSFIQGRGQISVFFKEYRHLWDLSNHLYKGHRVVWWVQELKRPDLEANHSFLFSAEVKSCGERYLQISIRFYAFRGDVYLFDTTPFVLYYMVKKLYGLK
jgi:hypothetical protein